MKRRTFSSCGIECILLSCLFCVYSDLFSFYVVHATKQLNRSDFLFHKRIVFLYTHNTHRHGLTPNNHINLLVARFKTPW